LLPSHHKILSPSSSHLSHSSTSQLSGLVWLISQLSTTRLATANLIPAPESSGSSILWGAYPSHPIMHEQIDRNTSNLPIIGLGHSKQNQSTTFARPVQMGLFARVTCYPPLGQLTCLPRTQNKLRSEKDPDDTVSTINYPWYN
jgi:hypothetical protein